MEQKTFFVRAEFCTGCGMCQLACSLHRLNEINPAKSRIYIQRLVMDGMMLPHICVNCKEPPCMEACRRHAIVKDVETGWVTINREKCNDCRMCVGACPYSAIMVTPEREVVLCDVCGGSPKCVDICPTGAIIFIERSRGSAGTTDKAALNIFDS
jgi:carbon-monoxide dehydrogenase iron sulfur subunit